MAANSYNIFVVIDSDTAPAAGCAAQLGTFGKVHEANSRQELEAIKLREGRVDALFVAFDPSQVSTTVLKRLRTEYAAPVYVLGEVPLDAVSDLYGAGVEDIIPVIDPTWLKHRFQTQRRPVAETAAADQQAAATWMPVQLTDEPATNTVEKTIVVVSAKGGEGKTSILSQLGMALAKKGFRPVALDADPAGNLARWIDEDAINSITQFKDEQSKRDKESLDAMLAVHRQTGLRVLPSPLKSVEPVAWTTIERALLAYRKFYSLILVDLPEGYTPAFERLAKDYATDIYFVVTTDRLRIERTREMANKMIERGVSTKKVHVIINKAKKDADVQVVRAMLSQLGFENIYELPYHPGLSDADQVKLRPLFSDPKSPYAMRFKQMIGKSLKLKLGSSEGAGKFKGAGANKGKPGVKKRKKQPYFSLALAKIFGGKKKNKAGDDD